MNFKYHLINITFGVAIFTTAGLANSAVKESFLMGGVLGVLTLAIIDWYVSWRKRNDKD